MNIEEIFRTTPMPMPMPTPIPLSAGYKNIMVNGTPPCQNAVFPRFPSVTHHHAAQNSLYQHQPLIHIPTGTTTTTLGELAASVDMMRAQITELSKRMDAAECNLSEFKNTLSNDVFLLKSTLSEHATELLNVRDVAENTYKHVKKTHALIKQQNDCIDGLTNVVVDSQNHKKQLHEAGIIRRRLSKVEDFTSEFYQHFDSFKNVKDIFVGLSDQIEHCDKDISSIVVNNNNDNNNDDNKNYHANVILNATTVTDENIVDLSSYFSNYENDDDDEHDFEKL
jgi:hypothetical protein